MYSHTLHCQDIVIYVRVVNLNNKFEKQKMRKKKSDGERQKEGENNEKNEKSSSLVGGHRQIPLNCSHSCDRT